jgi:hypothetical protein
MCNTAAGDRGRVMAQEDAETTYRAGFWDRTYPPRIVGSLLLILGVIALVLALVGLFNGRPN